jgi:hypothetical protein
MTGYAMLLERELSALKRDILDLSTDQLQLSEAEDLLAALTAVRTAVAGALVAVRHARDTTFRISLDRRLAPSTNRKQVACV